MTRPDILHKIAETALRVRMLEKELAPSKQPRRAVEDLQTARQELDRLLEEYRGRGGKTPVSAPAVPSLREAAASPYTSTPAVLAGRPVVHLYIYTFKRNPKRGTWGLIRTLRLHERGTPAAGRSSSHENAEVWMIEAESEQQARGMLDRHEAAVMYSGW